MIANQSSPESTGSVPFSFYINHEKTRRGQARRYRDWEYESEVWLALARMLLSFTESGYLGLSETVLEFPMSQGAIPDVLRSVSTWE